MAPAVGSVPPAADRPVSAASAATLERAVTPEPAVAPFAWRPVGIVAVVTGLVVLALSARYGYHRDELYFLGSGRHLAWGYPDQPPVVPFLARVMSAISPTSLMVLRLPSDVAVAGTVLLTGFIAREVGARRGGQVLAAVAIAVSNITLGSAHLLSTTTFGLTAWGALFALALHAMRTGDGRWWLLAGIAAGLGLLDNDLIAFLVAAVFVGVLAAGPRRVLASPWLWGGVAIAAALWSPYLVWQAHHGWPQLAIGRAIAAGSSGTSTSRWQIPIQQLYLASPPLVPIWVVGLVRLWRAPELRWCRAFGIAWVVLLVAFIATGGKPYYLALSFPLLLAAGAQPCLDWARRSRARIRLWTTIVAVTTAIDALVTLAIVPIGVLHDTPIVAMNYDAGEQVGWPTFAAEMHAAWRSQPGTVVVASNYGEAGALQRYYPAGRSQVYAVQNAYWLWGPPPPSTDRVVAVGFDRSRLTPYFTQVRLLTRLDNHVDVDDDEQGAPVWLASGRKAGWPPIWRGLRAYG